MALIPVIMCGGSGSRLWPVSRADFPKPYIELPNGDTLIELAYARAAALDGVKDLITVTNNQFSFLTIEEYQKVEPPDIRNTLILEPIGRDTAAAIAAAALHAHDIHDPSSVLLVMPADQLISDTDGFVKAVDVASQLASEGRLVTFGIKPTRPETGFGYIEVNGNSVLRFVEKPDKDTANRYLKSQAFFWNAGIFCFRADAVLNSMRDYCPDLLQKTAAALSGASPSVIFGHNVLELNAHDFCQIDPISFDYAVMERAKRIACVPVDIGWSDIGSWSSMAELVEPHDGGNRSVGEVIFVDSDNCFVSAKKRVVCAVGVKDLIVIDTEDALLIASLDGVQNVKYLYELVKEDHTDVATSPAEVRRPWGRYTVMDKNENYSLRKLWVKPGQMVSVQREGSSSDTWVVISGNAKLQCKGEEHFLVSGNSTSFCDVSACDVTNVGDDTLVLIEAQLLDGCSSNAESINHTDLTVA